MRERQGGKGRQPRDSSTTDKDREAAKRRFAEAIARAEFGRFYWGERSEAALRQAMERRRKPKS